MTETTKPTHEPEVEMLKAKRLYGSIIELLNNEQDVSMGSKVEALAQVLISISRSIDKTTPGEGDNVINFFLTALTIHNTDR